MKRPLFLIAIGLVEHLADPIPVYSIVPTAPSLPRTKAYLTFFALSKVVTPL